MPSADDARLPARPDDVRPPRRPDQGALPRRREPGADRAERAPRRGGARGGSSSWSRRTCSSTRRPADARERRLPGLELRREGRHVHEHRAAREPRAEGVRARGRRARTGGSSSTSRARSARRGRSTRRRRSVWNEFADLAPNWSGIRYDRIEDVGLQWPCTDRDHPGSQYLLRDASGAAERARQVLSRRVPAADRAAGLRVPVRALDRPDALPLQLGDDDDARGRRARQAGGAVRRDPPRGRGRRSGVAEGDWVRLVSRRGELEARAAIGERVYPGPRLDGAPLRAGEGELAHARRRRPADRHAGVQGVRRAGRAGRTAARRRRSDRVHSCRLCNVSSTHVRPGHDQGLALILSRSGTIRPQAMTTFQDHAGACHGRAGGAARVTTRSRPRSSSRSCAAASGARTSTANVRVDAAAARAGRARGRDRRLRRADRRPRAARPHLGCARRHRDPLLGAAAPAPRTAGSQELSLVGGIAAADAVELALGLAAQIKWPNDVMVNRYKVAGVLARGTDGRRRARDRDQRQPDPRRAAGRRARACRPRCARSTVVVRERAPLLARAARARSSGTTTPGWTAGSTRSTARSGRATSCAAGACRRRRDERRSPSASTAPAGSSSRSTGGA